MSATVTQWQILAAPSHEAHGYLPADGSATAGRQILIWYRWRQLCRAMTQWSLQVVLLSVEGSELSEFNTVDSMICVLVQNQVGALAGGRYVFSEINQVNSIPDVRRSVDRLLFIEIGVV